MGEGGRCLAYRVPGGHVHLADGVAQAQHGDGGELGGHERHQDDEHVGGQVRHHHRQHQADVVREPGGEQRADAGQQVAHEDHAADGLRGRAVLLEEPARHDGLQ